MKPLFLIGLVLLGRPLLAAEREQGVMDAKDWSKQFITRSCVHFEGNFNAVVPKAQKDAETLRPACDLHLGTFAWSYRKGFCTPQDPNSISCGSVCSLFSTVTCEVMTQVTWTDQGPVEIPAKDGSVVKIGPVTVGKIVRAIRLTWPEKCGPLGIEDALLVGKSENLLVTSTQFNLTQQPTTKDKRMTALLKEPFSLEQFYVRAKSSGAACPIKVEFSFY